MKKIERKTAEGILTYVEKLKEYEKEPKARVNALFRHWRDERLKEASGDEGERRKILKACEEAVEETLEEGDELEAFLKKLREIGYDA